ncbi:hypothetical protein [Aliivibrio logei]|uniref:hypothetical protein n=1 Tax=Aliivibrio logei TaxID=688 RepID=UPI00039EC051|nr:hypothetical protein [Aliivibrio logei]
MSENEPKSVAPIVLTAEQIFSLVGYGLTQEQLDSVRRELDTKIEHSNKELNTKIDELNKKLNAKIEMLDEKLLDKLDRLDDRTDNKFNLTLTVILASVSLIVAVGFWLG